MTIAEIAFSIPALILWPFILAIALGVALVLIRDVAGWIGDTVASLNTKPKPAPAKVIYLVREPKPMDPAARHNWDQINQA